MVFAATRGGAIGGKNRSGGGFEIEEFSARSVDEALAEASAKLSLPARELTYEIRDAGASGFLGIGSRPATVAVRIATPHTAASPSPSGIDTLGILPGDERDAFAEGSFVGGDADETAAKVRHPLEVAPRVRPGPDAGRNFERLLDACEALAAAEGMQVFIAGANMGRHEAYRALLARGFRTDIQGVTMHRPNEPGYNRPGVYIVDDWR